MNVFILNYKCIIQALLHTQINMLIIVIVTYNSLYTSYLTE